MSVQLLNDNIRSLIKSDTIITLESLDIFDPSNKYICRSSQPNIYSVFQEGVGDENMLKTKILLSLGYNDNLNVFFNHLNKSAIFSLPRFYNEYVGAIIFTLKSVDWENDDRFSIREKNIFNINKNLINSLNDDVSTFFEGSYYNIELDYLDEIFRGYSIAYYNANVNNYSSSVLNNETLNNAKNKILFQIKNDKKISLSSPIHIYKNKNDLKSYTTYFKIENGIEIIKNYIKQLKKSDNVVIQNTQNTSEIIADNTLLLEMYYDIKSIYDKWISYDSTGKPYNICFNLNKPLKEHFYFIDKAWNDIGSDVVLNPRTLINLFKESNMNSYQYMTKILDDNNFITFFAPTYISFKNSNDAIDMFTPQISLNNAESLPSMISMYHGGISSFLNNDPNFNSDGFDFDVNGLPKQFTLRKKASKHVSEDDKSKYNMTSFLVNFGDDNQVHFKSVNVTTEEHQNSSNYFKTISEIFDKGGAINRFYQGIDIYDLYKLRSYKCYVKAMGNFMYQPFQYFQLNIPLFKGAYMITDVSHTMTPHDCISTFTGIKISRTNYPIVDKITSFINLTFDEYNDSNKPSASTNVNEDSYPYDRNLTNRRVNIDVGNSNVILLSAVNEENNIVNYIIKEGLDRGTFLNNLTSVFKTPSSYGIGAGRCMQWVKHAMADLGIVSVPFGNLDAWDFIAGVDYNLLKFFSSTFINQGGYKTYDYGSVINEDLAIVWGYFPTSNHKRVSINAIKNRNNQRLISKLKEVNLTNFEFNPVTHIGLVYKGVFYDLVNGRVRQNQKASFVPLAYLPIYNKIINLIS